MANRFSAFLPQRAFEYSSYLLNLNHTVGQKMIARVPCPKCGAMILPTTVAATGGECMPCHKGIRQDVEAAKQRRAVAATSESPRLFDIRTFEEWKKLGVTAETVESITIEEAKVPAQLRPLIPYAVRWAISCDVRRGDYFQNQPPADIEDFYRTVTPYHDELNRWIDEPPLEEPKITFLIMLKAYSEAVPLPRREFRGSIMGKKK
jgi:hypothetical protein